MDPVLMNPLTFTVEAFQNEYLPAGGRDVRAIITVTAAGTAGRPPDATEIITAAEIIIIDCSASMRGPKMAEARRAAAAAVSVIGDGVRFAVLAGTGKARPVYPDDGRLAIATEDTRAAARQAVGRLQAGGGTAIGSWLRRAHEVFGASPAELRHAILLTDGWNEEQPGQLEDAIRLCEGVFSCDCCGLGTDWLVSELRKISAGLFGSLGIVPEPARLAADFEAMMQPFVAKEVADVMLRVWVPQTARLTSVEQIVPTIVDLAGGRKEAGAQTGDYPTGAWGRNESRDYLVSVEVQPAEVGQEILAARVSLVLGPPSGPQVVGQKMIKAVWTDRQELLLPRIGLGTYADGPVDLAGLLELTDAIRNGLAALRAGDLETATAKLGRAVALAHKSGREDVLWLLARVVDVIDPVAGTIRLKPKGPEPGRDGS